jgi:hypothetical protein
MTATRDLYVKPAKPLHRGGNPLQISSFTTLPDHQILYYNDVARLQSKGNAVHGNPFLFCSKSISRFLA